MMRVRFFKSKHRVQTALIISILCVMYAGQVVYTKMNQKASIAILGYHHIAKDSYAKASYPNNMWVANLSDFKKQMQYLYENGYHSVTLDDLYAWKMGKKQLAKKSVVITFDDGFLSSIQLAQPILESYGFQASVFAIGNEIKEHGQYDPTRRQHASLQDMKNSSLTFYSHSFDLHHKDGGFAINQMDKHGLKDDIKKSDALISSEYFAYPYGKYNDQMINILAQNKTKLAFGFHENRKATRFDGNYQLPRFCVNRYTTLDSFQAMLEGI